MSDREIPQNTTQEAKQDYVDIVNLLQQIYPCKKHQKGLPQFALYKITEFAIHNGVRFIVATWFAPLEKDMTIENQDLEFMEDLPRVETYN